MHSQGFAVSNGSFKPHQEAVAWIIEGSSLENRVIGECLIPGHDDDHSSFCRELTSIYTCLLFLWYCCGYTLPNKPSFHLLCDGKSVLYQLWNPTISPQWTPLQPLVWDKTTTQWMLWVWHTPWAHQRPSGYWCGDSLITCCNNNIEVNLLAKDKLTWHVIGPTLYYLPYAYIACYVGQCWVVKTFHWFCTTILTAYQQLNIGSNTTSILQLSSWKLIGICSSMWCLKFLCSG